MNRMCKKIEPLLYLYREGELTAREKNLVLRHTLRCERCAAIAAELRSMESSLIPFRLAPPAAAPLTNPAGQVMARIAGESADARRARQRDLLADRILFWLRFSLRFALTAAVVLLMVQQARDASSVSQLEQRLEAEKSFNAPSLSINDFAGSERRLREAMPGNDAHQFLYLPDQASTPDLFNASGMLELFRKHKNVLEQLAERYPGLSSVTLDDGLDDNEKRILATEGKAFLQDFEKLVREGDR